MARPPSKRPTDTELEILNALWELGPSTVREVHEHLSHARDLGHTTVLKVMQIMTDKGLVRRDESVRPQVYRAARTQSQTQKALVTDLLERAFDGSPGNLVLQALASRKTSPEERRKIQELLDKQERKGR